jgi:hypothetical protein
VFKFQELIETGTKPRQESFDVCSLGAIDWHGTLLFATVFSSLALLAVSIHLNLGWAFCLQRLYRAVSSG